MKPVSPDIHLDRFDSLVVACDFTAMSDRMLPIVGGLAHAAVSRAIDDSISLD